MHWLIIAITTAFCFGLYNFFIKISSGNIHEIVGAVILQIIAAMLGGIFLLFFKFNNQPLPVTNKGIWQAALAGLCVGLAEILTFVLYTRGVSVSVGTPLIVGGSLVVVTLLGWLFLREELNFLQLAGIILVIIGMVLISSGGGKTEN